MCRSCGHKFTFSNHIPRMRRSTNVIAHALNMYYMGKSLSEIEKNIFQRFNQPVSPATIHNWVEKFSDLAVHEAMKYQPKVGNIWVVGQDYIRIDQQKPIFSRFKKDNYVVFWDVIDTKTHFLLASQLCRTSATKAEQLQLLIEAATKIVKKPPKIVIIDSLIINMDAELTKNKGVHNTNGKLFTIHNDKELIELFHGLLIERTEKAKTDLKKEDILAKFKDRWIVYYNYFKAQQDLDKRTPGQIAGIDFPFRNWRDLIEKSHPR